MMHKSVLLDTSFFLRFLNDKDPLFKNADGYFRYFLQEQIIMMISTISIAEYCVGGHVSELPLQNMQIVPFNFDHAQRAGEFAKVVFNNKGITQFNQRSIIANDTKLFAQADVENAIQFYLTSDSESFKIYNILKQNAPPKFNFIDLNLPHTQSFGVLGI